jgi:tetratricopeptide (TPR) repeat protein
MTPEEALQIADEALLSHAGSSLSDVQRLILRESLAGIGYEGMTGYAPQHIKNEGKKLWDLLSAALGKKVSKTSFKGALEKRLKIGDMVPKPPMFSTYNQETWVGRKTLIDESLLKFQEQIRILWITGIPGIGKTTLGECLASRAWESNPTFQWVYLEVLEGQGADFTTVAADLLAKLGDRDLDPQERNDPKRLTDRLIRKLQSSCYWVQLDSLERLLNPEQGTEFADAHWVTFLQRCLTERDFASRLVLTAQALPSALVEFADRYPNVWEAKTLVGLSSNGPQNEHLEFFGKHGVAVDEENQAILSKLGQVYEGHTLVLQVMSGEIQADFAGDAARYWAVNQQELEQLVRSLDAKRLDETEYNDELDRRVRDRVKKSLQQLPTDAQDLLLRSSVYRRPVPKKFWLAMIDDRSSVQQKEAYRVLCDRVLVEREGIYQDQFLIRQHNLVRAIAQDLLKADTPQIWHQSKRQAAHLWLTAYEPAPDTSNVETVRGSLEAFHHYCEVEDWDAAKTILLDQKIGHQLQIWGDYQEMILLYQKLVGHLQASDEVTCKRGLGNAYFCLSNYSQATNHWQQSLDYARAIGDLQGEGAALGNLGLAYRSLSQYERAINYHHQHLVMARKIADYENVGNALGNLGIAHICLGQYEQARDYYQQHLTIAQEIGDRRGEGSALGGLGLAHHTLGQYERAIDFHQRSLTMVREIDDRRGESNALGNLGLTHHTLGQYEQAIDYYQQHLTIVQEIGDREGEGIDLGNLGLAYYNLGQYERAIDFHQRSLAIAQEIGNCQGEGHTLGNLGLAYYSLMQYEQAIDFCQQSLKIARGIADRRGEGLALTNMGATQLKLEQYPESLANNQTALEIFQETGDRANEAQILKNLTELHQALGEVEVAQQYCQQALALATELGIPLADECRKLLEEIENSTSASSG